MSAVRKKVAITPVPDAETQRPLIEPAPGFEPRPVPWTSVHVLPDGQTLEIHAVRGDGDQVHDIEVDEANPDFLLVTVWVAFSEPPTPAPRIAVAYPFRARHRLHTPFDGRPAMDGALGSEEDVRGQELARVTNWRRRMGLPIEPELVDELIDDARMPDGRVHGSEVMSDAENAWYRESLEQKEAAVNFAKNWLAEQPEDLDGHAEITWLGGGDYVQYVTAKADELRAAADADGIQRLRVETVRYPYRELSRLQTAVHEHLLHAGIGVLSSWIDVRSNTVIFKVSDDVDWAQRVAYVIAPTDAVTIALAG
jgi:hypothetical protein